jgi:hypothetical protein
MPTRKTAKRRVDEGATRTFELVLAKEAERALAQDKLDAQLAHIKARALGGNRASKGWKCKVSVRKQDPASPGLPYLYQARFCFTLVPRRKRSEESIRAEWEHMVKVATAAGNSKGWLPRELEGKAVTRDDRRVSAPATVEYAEFTIPANWMSWFVDLYGRDDQLELLFSALEEAVQSGFQNRFNVILHGPPGSGKTDVLRTLKRHLPPESYLEFDATNTTAAGAIEELRSRARMPRILFLEEFEKVREENDLKWLLSATDIRGEIRKVNFRGTVHKETKFICLATVNDLDRLKKMLGTALESRFPFQVECPHPDQETLRRILVREVRRRPGFREEDLRWVEPALELAGELGVTDPRRVICWCLTGKECLLDGSWQQTIKRTHPALCPPSTS